MIIKDIYSKSCLILLISLSLLQVCRLGQARSTIQADLKFIKLVNKIEKVQNSLIKNKLIEQKLENFNFNNSQIVWVNNIVNYRKIVRQKVFKQQNLLTGLEERVRQLEVKVGLLEKQQKQIVLIALLIYLVPFIILIYIYKISIKTSASRQFNQTVALQDPLILEKSQKKVNQPSADVVDRETLVPKPQYSITEKKINLLDKEISELYNNNYKFLLHDAIEVIETEDSLFQNRLGSSQSIILESVEKGRGNYWILNGKYSNYLVPKKEIKINAYNYKILNLLFTCSNYQSGNYREFNLVKPGKVVTKSQGLTWEIMEQGELLFK